MEKRPAVYILASGYNGTLYIGVTGNLIQRIWQHKNNLVEGFTERYGVHSLVHYELHEQMLAAIEREKQLKKGNRQWKISLIEKVNLVERFMAGFGVGNTSNLSLFVIPAQAGIQFLNGMDSSLRGNDGKFL